MKSQLQSTSDLHNTESGRLFMMGSGPSLLDEPNLGCLREESTWAVNRLPGWDGLGFTPTIHSISEREHCTRHGIKEFAYSSLKMRRFAIHMHRADQHGFQWVSKSSPGKNIFTEGFKGCGQNLPPIPHSLSTTVNALQLAAWMGFTEFYLLGNDMTPRGHAWDIQFDRSNYDFKDGLLAFRVARETLELHGRSLVDCSKDGRLSSEGILDYQPLSEVIKCP